MVLITKCPVKTIAFTGHFPDDYLKQIRGSSSDALDVTYDAKDARSKGFAREKYVFAVASGIPSVFPISGKVNCLL